jgi:hypothetical protein
MRYPAGGSNPRDNPFEQIVFAWQAHHLASGAAMLPFPPSHDGYQVKPLCG